MDGVKLTFDKEAIVAIAELALERNTGARGLRAIIEPVMTDAALSNLSFVGNMLIFCVGINLVFENTRIKVANMLPAIVVAVAWAFLPF